MIYDRNSFIWPAGGYNGISKDYIPLPEVTDQHLVNILNWIFDQPSRYDYELYEFLENEAKYRSILLFAEGKPRPVKEDDRWLLK